MRVIQVGGLAGPGPVAGGVWAVASQQTAALRAAGHAVTLVGGWHGGDPPTGETYVRVRELFPGAGLRGLYATGLPDLYKKLTATADVTHIHLSRDYLTTTALGHLAGMPVFVQPHGMIARPDSAAKRAFDALFGRRFRREDLTWLVLTAAERAALIDYGVRPAQIREIENGTADDFLPRRAPDGPPVLSFISRLHPRKYPEVFVEAGARVAAGRAVRLRLLGPDQGGRAEAERAARAADRPDLVDFVGPAGRERVLAELAVSAGVVLPSRGEVAPMIAIEAAAAGAPLVLTSDSGLSEIFARHDAALVVDPAVDSVAAAMATLLDRPDVGARIAANARALYESRWSTRALADRLEDLYVGVRHG